MAIPRDPMEENLRALEELENATPREKRADGAGQGPPRPPAKPKTSPPPPPGARNLPSPAEKKSPPDEAFPEVPAAPPPPQSIEVGPTRPPRADAADPPIRGVPPRRPVGHAPNRASPAAANHPIGEHPDYHCLNCGYGLFRAVGMRCTECGELYDEETLRTWFDGREEERLRQLTWFIYPILVLKAWMLPSIMGFMPFTCFNWLLFSTSAGISIWALSLLMNDRRGTIGGYYGMAGMFAAGMLLLLGLFGGTDFRNTFVSPAVYFGLDAVCASLLLLTLLHPPDDSKLWKRRSMTVLALIIAVSAPPFGGFLGRIEGLIREYLRDNNPGDPTLGNLSSNPVVATTLMTLLAVGIWLVVLYWLSGFRRRIYPKHETES